MTVDQKNEIIKEIGDDKIVTIPIVEDDGDMYDAYVTTTTMKQQQEKSYYASKNVYDCCLYPGEKLNMMFELINTPNLDVESGSQEVENVTIKLNS